MQGFFASFLPILEKLRQYKIEFILLLLALLTIFISAVIVFLNSKPPQDSSIVLGEKEENEKLFVDIAGAVLNPGVYEVSAGARLKDALFLAGGLSDTADKQHFFRTFNLSQILFDQQKIYIPSTTDVQEGKIEDIKPANQPTKININRATVEELDTLPGIGLTTAHNIIKNRPYKSIEELLTKKVLKKSVFEKIKDLIEN